MPTYELTCRECGHRFELFIMRLLRNEDLVCPKCGSTEIERGVGGGVLGGGTRTGVTTSAQGGCGSGRFV